MDKEKIRTILIVDDDRTTCRLLEKNIRRWGYNTVLVQTGKEAWHDLSSGEVRMAILDWVIPEIDGAELCRMVRRKNGPLYTYLILLTNRDHPQDIVDGLLAGADDYMTKPVNFMELRARLQTGQRIIDLEDRLLESQERLLELAEKDSLTSLWNRATILRFLQEELERATRVGYPISVLMLDIDHFKKINDSGGHKAGDKVLQTLAAGLKRCIRPNDKIGRYGGDEMLVILSNCTLRHVAQVAERLRADWAGKEIRIAGSSFALTLSIGCTSSECFSELTPDELILASDRALYQAKQSGRNLVAVSHELHVPAKDGESDGREAG